MSMPMAWVEASPVKRLLRRVYWAQPTARLSRVEFDLLKEAHPERFTHPMDPAMVSAGVLGILCGKFIYEETQC